MKSCQLNQLVCVTAIVTAVFGCGGESSRSGNTEISAGGTSSHDPKRETGGAVTEQGGGGSDAEIGGGTQRSGSTTSTLGGSSPNGGSIASGGASTTNGSNPASGGASTTNGSNPASGGQSMAAGGTTNVGMTLSPAEGGRVEGTLAGASSQGGVPPNPTEPVACKEPDCCIPLQLEVSNVHVYQVDDSAMVNLVVQTTDPDGIKSLWMAYAEITSSWGGTQRCSTDRMRGSFVDYMLISCPSLVPSVKFECDAPASVQVRLYSNAYNSTQPYDASCEGQLTASAVTFTVPVKCPTCPTNSYPGYQVCDYPEPPTSDSAFPRCTTFSQACHCPVNETTGARIWDCPHPSP